MELWEKADIQPWKRNVKIQASNTALPITADLGSDQFGKHCILFLTIPYILQFIAQNSLLMALRSTAIKKPI